MGIEASQIVGPLVGGAIGFASAIFAEPLRRRLFRPALSLTFGAGSDYQARTPETFERPGVSIEGAGFGSRQAEYVRVKVLNTSSHLAKACRAYLVNVERLGPHGRFESTIYCDTIPLAWACRGPGPEPFQGIDIPPNVPTFFDVLSVRENQMGVQLQTLVTPHRYVGLIAGPGTYRLTVQVSGDEVKPRSLKLAVDWSGDWDKMTTRLDSTQ